MECEMCGKKGDMFKTKIEGTNLNVCEKCSKFGQILLKCEENTGVSPKIAFLREKENETLIVSNCSSLVKNQRERMDLKQDELANKINEKTSVIQNIESGKFEPSLHLAKKLERFLNVKLIEKDDFDYELESNKNESSFTLGDMIKIKKNNPL